MNITFNDPVYPSRELLNITQQDFATINSNFEPL